MTVRILTGDCRDVLATLPDESVHCVVTSPPYFGLRDYGHAGQIGLEPTPDAFVAEMVTVFREVRRVLRKDGTCWLNLGDSYSAVGRDAERRNKDASGVVRPKQTKTCERCGEPFDGGLARRFCSAYCGGSDNSKRAMRPGGLKAKDLIGIPWMVAFALRADGWYLRSDTIWHKPNPVPESVEDRPTKAHEYLFLLTKSDRYHYDAEAIAEPATGRTPGNKNPTRALPGERPGENANLRGSLGNTPPYETRNRRSVWTIATQPNKIAHFAMMPDALAELCIMAGCPAGGTVLDPFGGAGTTGLVADRLQRNAILIELNPDNTAITRKRIDGERGPLFSEPAA